jgi:hypothetical protein
VFGVVKLSFRSPITKVKARPSADCTPFADVDRKAFDGYTKLIKTLDFKNFLKIDKRYPKFEWHPHPYLCKLGQLTAEGKQASKQQNNVQKQLNNK